MAHGPLPIRTDTPGAPNPGRLKQVARTEARRRLAAISTAESIERSRLICTHLGDLAPSRAVFLYLAAGHEEPDLSAYAQMLRQHAPTTHIYAPRVDWAAGTMHAVELTFDAAGKPRTEVRRHGVPEPVIDMAPADPHSRLKSGYSAVLAPGAFDLVLVPGVAFDTQFARLGRGAGFYDRWLAGIDFALIAGMGRPLVAGVCFDVQVVESLPTEPHDVRMDAIVTDRRLIRHE